MAGQIQVNETDCGVVTMAHVTGFNYDKIAEELGYKSRINIRDDIGSDTHWNHFSTLDKLGINWRKVNAEDILNGNCKHDKTAICLWLSLFAFHWVVLADVDVKNSFVRCYMGNGSIGRFSKEQFKSQFWAGYEVGIAGRTASLFDKFISKILRLIA
jgi:ABC-type bacteriocin/lantibiotic exporter with double-glycine peptidase domain